jgi:predicted nucleic acid-binding protein
MVEFDPKALERRTAELMQMGFKNFDALHVASAEQAGADVLASCDDGIRATSTRNNQSLKVRILSPIELAQEVLA